MYFWYPFSLGNEKQTPLEKTAEVLGWDASLAYLQTQ